MEKANAEAWVKFLMHVDLGVALRGQQKYAEAESSLLLGHKGLKEHAKDIPERLRAESINTSVEELIRLYEAWDKSDEADKWKKTLKELNGK